MATGHHIIAEFRNCSPKLLKLTGSVKPLVEKAVSQSGLTKICSKYHQFRPFGVTGFVLLAESHISIHTWPEKEYLALDIFTCGDPAKGELAFKMLKQGFRPGNVRTKKVSRE